jgi:hypothetical protein
MSQDTSIIICKGCGKECKRFLAGRYPNKKDKRYIDEHGKELNGHSCSSCHKAKVAQRKRLNSAIIKAAKELDNDKS